MRAPLVCYPIRLYVVSFCLPHYPIFHLLLSEGDPLRARKRSSERTATALTRRIETVRDWLVKEERMGGGRVVP